MSVIDNDRPVSAYAEPVSAYAEPVIDSVRHLGSLQLARSDQIASCGQMHAVGVRHLCQRRVTVQRYAGAVALLYEAEV